ncbi:MAG: PepSY-associated TM helix domain-containing protein [Gemmatimonadales bacterium]
MRSPLRTVTLKLHLFLGLTAGLVVMVVCLTGAVLAFEADLLKLFAPERYHVEGSGVRVPVAQAFEAARATLPEATLGGITVYQHANRPWEFNFGQGGRVHVDPFTGRVIESGVKRPVFFSKAQELHRWLLAPNVGRPIVGAATVMFVFILLFGFILWWPRTAGAFKVRINPFSLFTKHSSGRRKLHDLHVALGVWCLVPLLVMALTGLPEGYQWATKLLYVVTSSEQQPPAPTSTSDSTLAAIAPDSALAVGMALLGDAKQWSLRMPQRPTGAISVVSLPLDGWHDRVVDQVYLDRVTGAQLRLDRWNDLSPGFRARRSIYPWHFGTIWGFPSKLVAFLTCLFGASFPITGFLMYRAGKRTRS